MSNTSSTARMSRELQQLTGHTYVTCRNAVLSARTQILNETPDVRRDEAYRHRLKDRALELLSRRTQTTTTRK